MALCWQQVYKDTASSDNFLVLQFCIVARAIALDSTVHTGQCLKDNENLTKIKIGLHLNLKVIYAILGMHLLWNEVNELKTRIFFTDICSSCL